MTDASISDNGKSSSRERPTRDSYDAIAEAYADWIADELTARPHDRAVLGAFSELVLSTESAEVLDIGCGPGRITAFLAALGLSPSGLDLSPAMVGLARDLYPNLDFDIGTMSALPHSDASFAGLVAWYSIIHIPDDELAVVFAEAARILRPGGWFQLAFQLGPRDLPRLPPPLVRPGVLRPRTARVLTGHPSRTRAGAGRQVSRGEPAGLPPRTPVGPVTDRGHRTANRHRSRPRGRTAAPAVRR